MVSEEEIRGFLYHGGRRFIDCPCFDAVALGVFDFEGAKFRHVSNGGIYG
ncbi:MAG: hypothetical protein UU72_C0037G0012 [candidate division WWE3 bacterium GW2011_GWB1_41_6]|uniref:Uncharacterized protein n=1 Tax=candidate division WWE3 bacterium GW2011_GWB1_41_6 TaxID=1619112 RepID=A0A0G0WRH8_UNCKA|nr:MAG: hypothetical protein UU72_C0037G0012 [candidate division WWE3 bacterium GW2011_GWB1_41_6]